MKLNHLTKIILLSTALISTNVMSHNHCKKSSLLPTHKIETIEDQEPAQTSNVKMVLNLNATDKFVTAQFDEHNPLTYSFRTDAVVYDSLGVPYILNTFYTHTQANRWALNILLNGAILVTTELQFTSSGRLAKEPSLRYLTFSPTSGADSPQEFSLRLAGSTQFGDKSRLIEFWQDGNPAKHDCDQVYSQVMT